MYSWLANIHTRLILRRWDRANEDSRAATTAERELLSDNTTPIVSQHMINEALAAWRWEWHGTDDEAMSAAIEAALVARTEADATIEQLIEQSSLGTVHARALRGTVSDETANRLVAGSYTLSRTLAQIRLLIHDLDIARAAGTVLTYGYIQHRLRQTLNENDPTTGGTS